MALKSQATDPLLREGRLKYMKDTWEKWGLSLKDYRVWGATDFLLLCTFLNWLKFFMSTFCQNNSHFDNM